MLIGVVFDTALISLSGDYLPCLDRFMDLFLLIFLNDGFKEAVSPTNFGS